MVPESFATNKPTPVFHFILGYIKLRVFLAWIHSLTIYLCLVLSTILINLTSLRTHFIKLIRHTLHPLGIVLALYKYFYIPCNGAYFRSCDLSVEILRLTRLDFDAENADEPTHQGRHLSVPRDLTEI